MNWNRYKNIDRKIWNFWSNPNFAIEKMEFQVLGIGIRINFLKRLLLIKIENLLTRWNFKFLRIEIRINFLKQLLYLYGSLFGIRDELEHVCRYKNINQSRKVWNFFKNPNFAIEEEFSYAIEF